MSETTVYVFTAVIGLVLVLLLGHLAQVRRRGGSGQGSDLPGPRGLPLLGHSLTLRGWGLGLVASLNPSQPATARGSHNRSSNSGSGSERLLATLRQWSEQYGGAFQLQTAGLLGRLLLLPVLGGFDDPRVIVVLSDPAAVHALLALDDDVAPKSRRYYGALARVLHPAGVLSCATAPSAGQTGWVRRSLLHAFSGPELEVDFEVAKAKSLLMARLLLRRGPGAVVDVWEAALRLSLDVMGLSKLGYDFKAVESGGEVLLLRLLREVAAEGAARVRGRRPMGRLAPWLLDSAAEGQNSCRILQEFVEKVLWADIEARGPPPADDVTLAAQLARLRLSCPRCCCSGWSRRGRRRPGRCTVWRGASRRRISWWPS
ncbi:hypothetical protein Agub_g10282 [Astrephomene gubernaculifera]|uniref:Cytochrome P450 n=1 Tax=Astrephomene gubernaculifera TaxID=47775 RepID=A0AAD3DUJ3_9CHLO|nr:hypothetical protein Agub_g10282 [Astrephomene gubernaculifera]